MVKDEKLDKLRDFLNSECPPEGGCMLCMTTDDADRWLLVVRHITGDGKSTFTINDRLWYDYGFMWNDENPWRVTHKEWR